MKGKKLSNKDMIDLGLGGLLSGFAGMMYESEAEYKQRKVENTELENGIIDTAFTPDTGYFETGIKPQNMEWIIVEEYSTHEDATRGHKKWVRYMGKNPKKLYSVQLSEWKEI